MSILDKITEFFIPTGGGAYEPSSFDSPEAENAPIVRSQVEQINDDLAQLIELGEYEKALQLGRKYNFFNQHLLIAHAAVGAEAFDVVELSLHDIALGPLRGMIAQAITQSGDDEFFYLPRSLYLVGYIRKYFQQAHYHQQLTEDMIELWKENRSFQNFTQRFESQLAIRDADGQYAYAKRMLEQHVLLNYEKLNEIFDLDRHAFAIDATALEGTAIEDYFADQRIALHNQISEYKREAQRPEELQHFMQAQKNIDAYLEAGEPKGYILSQAKMDFATIADHISLDAAISLVRKLTLLDYYPMLAYQYYQGNDLTTAYDIMREFIHRSSLLSQPHSFVDERLKSEVINFIVYLGKCGPDGCRHQIANEAAASWHPQYAMDAIAKLAEDADTYSPERYFPVIVIEPLKQSTKLFFNV